MTSANLPLSSYRWLRSPSFDGLFIGGNVVLALMAGFVCAMKPQLFPVVLFLNLWLLGYHHVIATFTRIGFDKASRREHRFLVYYLPFIVLAAVVGMASVGGAWVIATTYLYWQWFHYTRQSYGIARAYIRQGSAADAKPVDWRLDHLAMYALPLHGILYRSWQSPDTFLTMPVWTLPVSGALLYVTGGVAALLFAAQLIRWVSLHKQGRLPRAYILYMLSHYAIFTTGYLLISNMDYGWLVVSIWHNLQYLMFVWHSNNMRYQNREAPEHRVISWLSQNDRVWKYVAVCLVITTLFYAVITMGAQAAAAYTVLPAVLMAYMTINFHHYVVDAVIWRKKKPKPV